MSDIERKMAEWRKTLWGTGPCPDSSQENFRLTDEEREVVGMAMTMYEFNDNDDQCAGIAATLRGLLERTA